MEEDLLFRISDTKFANLLDYKNRYKVWSKLSEDSRNNFLSETAKTLLEKLSKKSSTAIPDDDELKDYISESDVLAGFLYHNRNDFEVVLPIFMAFPKISEENLRGYMYHFGGNLNKVTAIRLGRFVRNRNLRRVAKIIYDRTNNKHSQFAVALNECWNLLGFIDRGYVILNSLASNVKITEDMWWDEFKIICYKLYDEGPTDRKVWIEAGGKEYDLLNKGTVKELWIDALNKLRAGGCEGITLDSLLEEMLEEYNDNDELITIIQLKNECS